MFDDRLISPRYVSRWSKSGIFFSTFVIVISRKILGVFRTPGRSSAIEAFDVCDFRPRAVSKSPQIRAETDATLVPSKKHEMRNSELDRSNFFVGFCDKIYPPRTFFSTILRIATTPTQFSKNWAFWGARKITPSFETGSTRQLVRCNYRNGRGAVAVVVAAMGVEQ